MLFVYNYMVLYSLHEMYGSEFENACNVHNEAKASEQIYTEQVLTADDLMDTAKVSLVKRKEFEEV